MGLNGVPVILNSSSVCSTSLLEKRIFLDCCYDATESRYAVVGALTQSVLRSVSEAQLETTKVADPSATTFELSEVFPQKVVRSGSLRNLIDAFRENADLTYKVLIVDTQRYSQEKWFLDDISLERADAYIYLLLYRGIIKRSSPAKYHIHSSAKALRETSILTAFSDIAASVHKKWTYPAVRPLFCKVAEKADDSSSTMKLTQFLTCAVAACWNAPPGGETDCVLFFKNELAVDIRRRTPIWGNEKFNLWPYKLTKWVQSSNGFLL